MDYLDEKKIDWKIINSYFNSNNYYFTISQIELLMILFLIRFHILLRH